MVHLTSRALNGKEETHSTRFSHTSINPFGLWAFFFFSILKLKIASLCSIQDTGCLGWCTGLIQRDDMRWEVGGGFRTGNSCTPVADSCQCMAKPI